MLYTRNLYASRIFMFLSKEEKERRIIDRYYNQGKTTREIVEELRVSPNYVSAVLKKHEEEKMLLPFLKLSTNNKKTRLPKK